MFYVSKYHLLSLIKHSFSSSYESTAAAILYPFSCTTSHLHSLSSSTSLCVSFCLWLNALNAYVYSIFPLFLLILIYYTSTQASYHRDVVSNFIAQLDRLISSLPLQLSSAQPWLKFRIGSIRTRFIYLCMHADPQHHLPPFFSDVE